MPNSHAENSSVSEVFSTSFSVGLPTETPPFSDSGAASSVSSEAIQSKQSKDEPSFVAIDLAAIIELTTQVAKHEDYSTACKSLVDSIAVCIQERQPNSSKPSIVVLAHVDAEARPKLVSVSDRDQIPSDPALVSALEAVVAECVARNHNARWTRPNSDGDNKRSDDIFNGGRHALLCHRQLAEHLSVEETVSVLCKDASGTTQAIVVVASEQAISLRTLSFLTSISVPVASNLALVDRAQPQTLIEKSKKALAWLRSKWNLTVGIAAALLTTLALFPANYKVTTECEVLPEVRQFVTAPFDSIIDACDLEAGDFVQKGQRLALLDGRELELELAQIQADRQRAEKSRDGHVALHENGEAKLAALEVERLRAREQLLELRRSRLAISAPIEGVILAGELSDSEGAPVEKGATLFEIAPHGDYRIEIAIPDADVRHVRKGMPVSISLDAFPFRSWNGKISEVSPASELIQQSNVFTAKVVFEESLEDLRPGMQGTAFVTSDRHPLAWNLLHKPVSECLRWLGW